MLILKNARIFDGVNEELEAKTLVVEDGKIYDITQDIGEECDKGEIVDLTGCVISPGFIDCHLHFLLDEIPEKERQMNDQTAGGVIYSNVDSYVAYRGAAAARATLHAGFTTVYDGGGVNHIDVALREAINLGFVEGPDYNICGREITAWPSHFRGLGDVTYGPWMMRQAIRERLYWSVNHVKIEMSAPIRSLGRSLEKSAFTVEELLAATDEAHSADLLVSTHTRGANAIIDSLNGGVDLIVHGTGMNDQAIELILKKGKYLLPTMASPPPVAGAHIREAKSNRVIELLEATGRAHTESVKRAYQAGVKIAFSTDAGGVGIRHGENALEMLRMRDIGMSALECMRSATSEAAMAVNRQDSIGRVAKGLKADLVVLGGNPMENLEAVMDVKMVIKGGLIAKRT